MPVHGFRAHYVPGSKAKNPEIMPSERRRNVKGAFRATQRPPSKLALIDDVYTTGATVSAAATALRKAGARHVEVVTFARAVR
jgi:predicted amidophosphoribosyltransferase